jgi:hypothetical protein
MVNRKKYSNNAKLGVKDCVKEKKFHKVTNKKLQIHKIALYLQSLAQF